MGSFMRRKQFALASVLASFFLVPALVMGADEQAFKGKIGESLADSEQYWPEPVKAPERAPNVLVWLIDDMGFGHSSAFGGLTPMPNIEQLADNGLRYNNFHTTALCSPSRAAITTELVWVLTR